MMERVLGRQAAEWKEGKIEKRGEKGETRVKKKKVQAEWIEHEREWMENMQGVYRNSGKKERKEKAMRCKN